MAKNLYSLVIGVDEAGRGPLLGDLVIAAAVFDEKTIGFLSELGVRDSKELTPSQRKNLVKHIIDQSIMAITQYIPPIVIDKYKLNKLVADNVVYLLNHVLSILSKYYEDKCLIKIYIDEIKGFREKIRAGLTRYERFKILVYIEPGADKKYVAVSAASILAKFYRDENLYSSKKLYGEFGSGYPTDPRTRNWVREYYETYREPPPIVRRSWKTLLAIAPEWFRDLKRGRSILDFT